jgi:hypothetical protein
MPVPTTPKESIGAYYPETNALLSLAHHDLKSKTPAAKSIPGSGQVAMRCNEHHSAVP